MALMNNMRDRPLTSTISTRNINGTHTHHNANAILHTAVHTSACLDTAYKNNTCTNAYMYVFNVLVDVTKHIHSHAATPVTIKKKVDTPLGESNTNTHTTVANIANDVTTRV